MRDSDNAKALLQADNYSCVLCKGEIVYTSILSGVAPMVDFIRSGIDLSGFSAADKIVGKAAAMLFVLAGVIDVYAPVMSAHALEVFSKHKIRYTHDTLTEVVVNRAGTGSCPMELAVKDINDPRDAFEAILQTQEFLKRLGRETK